MHLCGYRIDNTLHIDRSKIGCGLKVELNEIKITQTAEFGDNSLPGRMADPDF